MQNEKERQSIIDELTLTNKNLEAMVAEMQRANNSLIKKNQEYQEENTALRQSNGLQTKPSYQFFDNNNMLLMKFPSEIMERLDIEDTELAPTLKNILTEQQINTLFQHIKKVFANAETVVEEIESIEGKWLQLTVAAQRSKDNVIVSVMVTFYNITALKNNQVDLTKRNARLSRINEDLDNFMYTASHDLLGPLGNIEASLSGIQRKASEADFDIYIQVIDSSIKKFGSLIRNLVTIAKLESEMTAIEWVDLEEIIANVQENISNKSEFAGATIITDLEVSQILFSKKNLQSILYNLITNAIKFKGKASPVIKISSKLNGENTLLLVWDNGKGMSAAAMDKVFQMYGRLNNVIEGNGIGLYLAKKMINATGGQITVSSEVGKGSEFVITFQNSISIENV